MLSKTNLEERLEHTRSRRKNADEILADFKQLLAENELQREDIQARLRSTESSEEVNEFDLDQLEAERIYQLEDIRNLCVTYRLRFLDARYFKGDFPEETITRIRELEARHGTSFKGFKIVAPSKRLLLENADDPCCLLPWGTATTT